MAGDPQRGSVTPSQAGRTREETKIGRERGGRGGDVK